MLALSVRQPWAWLIVHRYKPVENRTWPTRYRGPVAIHASASKNAEEYAEALWGIRSLWMTQSIPVPPLPDESVIERGGFVGVAQLTDCVQAHPSPYFCGPFGHVMADAQPIPFIRAPGRLQYFKVEDDIEAQIREYLKSAR
jgi:ASCH domain